MKKQIILNLPVKDLDKSKTFFPLSALPSFPGLAERTKKEPAIAPDRTYIPARHARYATGWCFLARQTTPPLIPHLNLRAY